MAGSPAHVMREEDIIEIVLHKGERDGLGFNIRGGSDMRHIEEDPGIFVTKIREHGAAARDGRLQEGDKILSINDQSLENVQHKDAVRLFQATKSEVRLRVYTGGEMKIQESHQRMQQKAANGDSASKSATDDLLAILPVIGMAAVAGFVIYKYGPNLKRSLMHTIESSRRH